MKKRLLLIRPNSSIESTPPPLGLMYVASYLRSQTGDFDIKIIDARVKDLSLDKLKEEIVNFGPDHIGITSLHADSKYLHQVAKIAREIPNKCTVIVGGPYATSDYLRILEDQNIDFCVIGEGELTFAKLMFAIRDTSDLTQIKGLAFRKDGNAIYTGYRQPVDDIDRLPFPAWDLIDLNEYFYGRKRPLENPMQVHKRAVPLLSSRGCPFRCIYCHDIFGKRFRGRSSKNIIGEIKFLIEKYAIQEIEFLDDTFNFDVKRAKNICDCIIENNFKLKICFSNGIRLDLIDDELISKLKEAGTYRVNYGIESASPRIQKIMKKGLNLNIANKVINETVKHKIACGGFFMLGFPSETEEEVSQTIDFAVKSKLHTAVFALVTPYPGTEIYNMAKDREYDTNVSFSTVQKASLNLSSVEDKKLENLRISAYRKFYINPLRMLRIWRVAPKKWPLFKNFLEVIRVSFFKKELYG